MTGRVIVGLLWLTILIVAAGAWKAGASRPLRVYAPVAGAGFDFTPGDAADSDADAPPVPPVDLYGNEIDDAVSDYRIDVRGDLYERHAPDIEVTQLTAPSI